MQGASVTAGETLSGGSEKHAGNTGKKSMMFQIVNCLFDNALILIKAKFLERLKGVRYE